MLLKVKKLVHWCQIDRIKPSEELSYSLCPDADIILCWKQLSVNYYYSRPLVANTSRKRAPFLNDQFSKISKVSQSNHGVGKV